MTVRKRTVIGAVALVISSGLAVAPPASASVSQGYIGGTGSLSDDWGDEGLLSTSSHAHSNATALWQAVLWADGARESNGTYFDYSDIDCRFGANTKATTKYWQKVHDLPQDGVVGPRAFGRADNQLWHDGGNVVKYFGHVHSVWLKRVNGQYEIRVKVSAGYRVAYYNKATVC
ncbi:peptidoglycan-binding domain-containing protein [Streptomyces hyaluromycini]|uniref:peptidoglycan-binding domain-containing protein n=1 Tax=Streptomyces hyaluromycini TaxID=1377993 RepID=UPI000B5C64BF|nr:peptidoglycan-binding domain-containing protein [Streptomyces hyaluromycini]